MRFAGGCRRASDSQGRFTRARDPVPARDQARENRVMYLEERYARVGAQGDPLLWTGSDPVRGFQGLRVRLSFKPKPLTGSDPFNLSGNPATC
jgi:hypothetical protein